MEVKVGIQNAPRELVIETDASAAKIQQDLGDALEDNGILTLSDSRGNIVLVPAAKIAYVELGSAEPRRIGFGA
ncbi:MAG TPA: DUF3107 domain-containing protein [Streptosporangiaceae bacterium]|jgi:hypothetical protein